MADNRIKADRAAVVRVAIEVLESQLAKLDAHDCLLPAARLAQTIDCLRVELENLQA